MTQRKRVLVLGTYLFFLWTAAPNAGLDVPGSAPDLSAYAKKTDVPGLSPVTSVNKATGDTTSIICASGAIAAGNTVTNTTTETAFAPICFVAANRLNYVGASLNLKTFGLLGVNAVIPSLQGRIMAVQDGGSPIPCTTANKCVLILDTGATAGLTTGSGLRWDSDVGVKILSAGTTATGRLDFQTGTTAGISVFASTSTSTTPTYAAVDWSVNETIYYTTTWSQASTSNYIQILSLDGR